MTFCQLSFKITENKIIFVVSEHCNRLLDYREHSELFSTHSIISILGKGKGEKILQHKVKEAPEMKG